MSCSRLHGIHQAAGPSERADPLLEPRDSSLGPTVARGSQEYSSELRFRGSFAFGDATAHVLRHGVPPLRAL